MSAIKKPVLILLGLVFILFAVRALGLVFGGEMGEATIDQASLKQVKSQTRGGRHSTAQFTGLYILKTRVKYHFDVYPTPAEALQRGSEAPIQTGIKGCDILSDLSSRKDPKYFKGDEITILYLKMLPQINAAYQPNNLKFYGFVELLAGVLLLVWGLLSKKNPVGNTLAIDQTDATGAGTF